MIDLTSEQKDAQDMIYDWFNSKNRNQIFKLGGYAGTGKTSLISYIIENIRGAISFVTYTAKASVVLKTKLITAGIDLDKRNYCGTIHSFIYRPVVDEDTGEIIGWDKREEIDVKKYSLIIIDEASMVDEYILNDLLSFKKPLLAIGDCFQLPPIEGKLNLMLNPDFVLSEIHRQAEDNPIIKLSEFVRKNGFVKYGMYGKSVAKVPRNDPLKGRFIKGCKRSFSDSMILSGFNRTRVKVNKHIRKYFGFTGEFPQRGERVVCLNNNYDSQNVPLVNGQTGTVVTMTDFKTHLESQVKIHGTNDYYFGPVCKDAFNNPKPKFDRNKTVTRLAINDRVGDLSKEDTRLDYFDFGYCMTVHKAQGSQARRVMVIEERSSFMDDETWARWLYTAITRAEEQLLILGAV